MAVLGINSRAASSFFKESISKAQLLLDDLGAPRVDDATAYNLVVSQYLKLYLKINPRTGTDLLAMYSTTSAQLSIGNVSIKPSH